MLMEWSLAAHAACVQEIAEVQGTLSREHFHVSWREFFELAGNL
jgi:hypothetical protein